MWLVVLFFTPVFAISTAASEHGITFASEAIRFTAYFNDEQVRIVTSDGQEFALSQVISASGAKYADRDIVFWNKGDEAFLEMDGVAYDVRVVDPDTDPWERARRAGASFRAIGQEPGWHLEIREGERLHLSLDYGETTITTPIALLEVNYVARTRTYRTLPPISPLELTVTIYDQPCYDAMSGEGFTAAVTVKLHASQALYSGCGRDL